MDKNTPIILSNSLNVVRGGVTKAVFTRANTLAKSFDKVYILTFLYQQNHKDIIDELYSLGLLDKKVEVLNLFEDLKPDRENNTKNSKQYIDEFPIKENGLIEFQDKKQDLPSYRYYNDKGLYVFYKRFDSEGNVLFIDYMDEGRHRTKREEYKKDGYLVRIRHMDNVLNKPRLDQYFDNKGKCYLTVWVNPETEKDGRFVVFGGNGEEYETVNEIRIAWVEETLKEIQYPVLMTDTRENDKISINIKHNNLKRIAVIHSTHLKKPYNINAEIRDNNRDDYKFLFENLNEFQKVIFLTNEQKMDVQKVYGNNNRFIVIPHSVQKVNYNKENECNDYNPYLAVTLARYVKQKGLDEAIKAFKFVADKIPSAEYHIYGYGKELNNLKQLIKELNLENNIKLKGFTKNSTCIYKSATCSILTSEFEGFGMVLTESLAAGTPVVSYDTKYGPNEIVRDGVDGYLVEKGNQSLLAEKIIKLMEDNILRNKLSKNALEVNRRFSIENYKKDWENLLLNI